MFVSKCWCLKAFDGPSSFLNTKCFDRDEDMQSLASLMSVKHSDIGNLDDFDDGDDEAAEDRRSGGLGSGPAALFTGEAEEILEEVLRISQNRRTRSKDHTGGPVWDIWLDDMI